MTQVPMTVSVYHAADIIGAGGAALGLPMSFADELVLDDTYRLTRHSRMMPISLALEGGVLLDTEQPELRIYLDSCLTLMTPASDIIEALILVAVRDRLVDAVYVLPLGGLDAQVDYRLISVARHTVTRRFAQMGCGAFASGTRITLHDGRLCPVEALAPGDRVLTRDHGAHPLRWVGKTTLRASGSFAPVVITKGALHNAADLVVRADHRLFVYQRRDDLGAGRAEVLIRARYLVDGDSVYQRNGGFVDYYQLVLDAHHLIYAEGICVESQRVDAISRPALPDDAALPDHSPTRLLDYEIDARLITPGKAAHLLRKAASG